jgi:hypothetical protein
MADARMFLSVAGGAALGLLAWNSGCGGASGPTIGGRGGSGNGASGEPAGTPGGGAGAPMIQLATDSGPGSSVVRCTSQGQCVDSTCSTPTSISGQVFDPAGTNPLYDIAVYVPEKPPDPLAPGASCAACNSLYTGGVVAGGLTDPAGHFVLQNVPTGSGVPLVVQIGKWRRQYVVDVKPCQDNPVPGLRLPRNGIEGELPAIAVSTGGADSLECLFRRIGVDESEYTSGAGGAGHIHIFQGGSTAGGGAGRGAVAGTTMPGATTSGGSPGSAAALWRSAQTLLPYDMVILSCEGGETANVNAQALSDYASAGGRVFASHYQYAWFVHAPFSNDNLAQWTRGANNIGNISGIIQTTLPNGSVFPKGAALEKWLSNVNGLTGGLLPIQASRHNADVTVANTPSTPWIVAGPGASAPGATQYFSWDMPIGAAAERACGRVVYSDLHVGAASGDYGQAAGAQNVPANAVVPSGCAANALSPQEKALEFMIFDLSSCLTPVGSTPMAPVPAGQ